MNFAAVVGWVLQWPVLRVEPETKVEVLTWDGGVNDRRGNKHRFHFEIVEPGLIAGVADRLVPGASYLVEDGELITREHKKGAIHLDEREVIRCHRIKFHKRKAESEETT